MRENAMKVYRIDYRYTGNGSMCITAESPEEASGILEGLDNPSDRWQLEMCSGMEALEAEEPVEATERGDPKWIFSYDSDPRAVFAIRWLEARGYTVTLPPGHVLVSAVRPASEEKETERETRSRGSRRGKRES